MRKTDTENFSLYCWHYWKVFYDLFNYAVSNSGCMMLVVGWWMKAEL